MEPVSNFAEMFERPMESDKSIHVYIEAKKISKYACPGCSKMCKR